jgi:hypothetical protein
MFGALRGAEAPLFHGTAGSITVAIRSRKHFRSIHAMDPESSGWKPEAEN